MTIKMRNLRVTTTVMVMAFVSLTAISCKDGKKEDSGATMGSEVTQEETATPIVVKDSKALNPESNQVVVDYMTLKDALVETDEKAAADAGKQLENTLKGFNVNSYSSEQQKELNEITASSMEHAEQIGKSDIEQQREHFEMLTKDMIAMVAITGTDNTLYQQFCPMYGDGGAWLSMEKNIRNPYFGSKMMKCGEVQKEIN